MAIQARLLVVEDNPALRRAYAAILLDAGYEVSTAVDGEVALRMVERSGCFDVVVLDYSLGGRTGGEVGIELDRICPKSSIIVVSGYSEIDLPGGWVVLQKPVTEKALLGAIEALIREPPGA